MWDSRGRIKLGVGAAVLYRVLCEGCGEGKLRWQAGLMRPYRAMIYVYGYGDMGSRVT